MSTLGTSVTTLVDWAKRVDPNGKIAAIVELLSQTNQVLEDMVWKEGNLPTGERTVVRTGLPTVAWRLLNAGVTPSKSLTSQIDEACAMLEGYSEVDVDLAKLNGEEAAFRISEAQSFLEAMNQEFVDTMFYGNSGTAPSEFTGFSPRYSSLSAANGENIVNAGGTGSDNSSIWLICWGAQTVHGIFPKGSKMGLQHNDLGMQTIQTGTGAGQGKFQAYVDHFQWKCGIALKDWRYAARLCNIDISLLIAKTSAADLFDGMIKLTHRIPNPGMGKCAFYANRTVLQMLDIQGRDDVTSGGQLSYQMVDGKRVSMFRGYPVRLVDRLVENETLVA